MMMMSLLLDKSFCRLFSWWPWLTNPSISFLHLLFDFCICFLLVPSQTIFYSICYFFLLYILPKFHFYCLIPLYVMSCLHFPLHPCWSFLQKLHFSFLVRFQVILLTFTFHITFKLLICIHSMLSWIILFHLLLICSSQMIILWHYLNASKIYSQTDKGIIIGRHVNLSDASSDFANGLFFIFDTFCLLNGQKITIWNNYHHHHFLA